MDEYLVDDYRPADFALDDMSVQTRTALRDDFMGGLDDVARNALTKFPGLLCLALEVSMAFELTPAAAVKVAGNLTRYLQPRCLDHLEGIVNEALLARLPSYC